MAVTRKFDAAREAAFLAALETSGNLTLAADEVGVSRSWVLLRRGESGRFDDLVRATLAAVAEGLPRRAAAGERQPAGFLPEGIALTVRGAARLEAALLDGWCDPRADHGPGEPPRMEKMSAEQALELLKLHRLRDSGGLGTRPCRPGPEHLRDQFARRLANLRALDEGGERP